MNHSRKMDVLETEEELISKAQDALSHCNWVVGECAGKWTKKYAKGRTDADFGAMVGLSSDQVYQRRRVWETFADVSGEYPSLKWSHFYVALKWDDAPECLHWAVENGATVAEMRAWRRLQHGEDLTTPPFDDEEAGAMIAFVPTDPTLVRDPADSTGDPSRRPSAGAAGERDSESDRARVAAVARESDGGDGSYAPFRQGAGSPAPQANSAGVAVAPRPDASAEQIIMRMTKTLERCQEALTPEVCRQFKKLPDKVRNRFIKAVGELSSKAAGLM